MSAQYTSLLLFADLQRQLNRLFEKTIALHRGSIVRSAGWHPKIDVVDHPDRIVVSVEVPGIPAADLEVALSGNVLTIRGVKRVHLPADIHGTFRCVERERGEFERRIQLAHTVNPPSSRCHLGDGLLSIELSKLEDRRDRTYVIPLDDEGSER